MQLDDRELEQIADKVTEKLMASRQTFIAPRLMDVPQTAAYLGRSVSSVKHLIAKGAIPVTRLDDKVQVDRLLLDQLIKATTV
jgi:hypothetical protein